MTSNEKQIIRVHETRTVQGVALFCAGLALVTISYWAPEALLERIDALVELLFLLGVILTIIGGGRAFYSDRLVVDRRRGVIVRLQLVVGVPRRREYSLSSVRSVRVGRIAGKGPGNAPSTIAFRTELDCGGPALLAAYVHDYEEARARAERFAQEFGVPLIDKVDPGASASPAALGTDNPETASPGGTLDELSDPPFRSRIRVHLEDDGVCVELPPFSAPWYVYGTGAMLCALLTYGAAVGMRNAAASGIPNWAYAFWGVPVLLGAGAVLCGYGALMWSGRYERIIASPGALRHEWVLRNSTEAAELPASEIREIGLTENAVEFAQLFPPDSLLPMKGPSLTARSEVGTMTMGSTLTPAEAGWLREVLCHGLRSTSRRRQA